MNDTATRRPAAQVRALRDLPALATSTVAMYSAGVLLLAIALATWEPGKNPAWVIGVLLGLAVAIVAAVVVRGERFTRAEALVLMLVQLASVVTMTWTTELQLAALANGSVLPIIGAYATWFLHPVWGRVAVYGAAVAWLVAVVSHDDRGLLGFAASIAVQAVLAAEAFARIHARFERLARTDPLTGVLNRRGLVEAASRALVRAARRGRPLSVVVIDLDDLRVVNNTRGHAAGDDLITAVTADWTARLRSQDLVGRTGGDEFVVVLPGATAEEAARTVARLSTGSPAAWTAGVALARPGDDVDAVLARADAQMYEGKARREPGTPGRTRPDARTHDRSSVAPT